jgi:hypothetical protein
MHKPLRDGTRQDAVVNLEGAPSNRDRSAQKKKANNNIIDYSNKSTIAGVFVMKF